MNISKILFVIGAIVCLPLYGFLCITNLDPTTGFFTSSNLLTTVFYGVLIAVPVLIILLSTVIQKRFAFSISNSRMLGVLSLLMGALMIASGVAPVTPSYVNEVIFPANEIIRKHLAPSAGFIKF